MRFAHGRYEWRGDFAAMQGAWPFETGSSQAPREILLILKIL
jgi:hypothetical protein